MDTTSLRAVLRPFVGGLKDHCTNTSMPEFCQRLGLPSPSEVGDKRSRMHAAFDALPDGDVPKFAAGLLAQRMLGPRLRNQVQDIIWSEAPLIQIPKRSRRELARALQRLDLFQHWENFAQLLQDVFDFEVDLTWLQGGFLTDIHRHFVRNREDADVEALFEQLKALDLSDRRFCLLLEGLASADVQVDAETQLAIVATLNPTLQRCGAELRQTGEAGGYPVFSIVALHPTRGRPKNLIFASNRKPDIRFRDAVNNDVEIVSNVDDVLVYDRTLGVDGLRWRDMQNWWAETTEESDPERAKSGLYRRLLGCLPKSSPPQRKLFELYFRSFGQAIPNLPALLPEVWLHWDPKTVEQRGPSALLTHRMDFLMLLPGGARIVLEVDGTQHYADAAGRADARQYARLAAGERELKLAGYDVYRFAGVELQAEGAPGMVKSFFEMLFMRYGVSTR